MLSTASTNIIVTRLHFQSVGREFNNIEYQTNLFAFVSAICSIERDRYSNIYDEFDTCIVFILSFEKSRRMLTSFKPN